MMTKKQQVLRANGTVRESVHGEGAAFIQICCDWTKTAIISFGFTNKFKKKKPTVCHVVSYVCLSQQYNGQFFGPVSAEIILLRLEKWMVLEYEIMSVLLSQVKDMAF